MFLTYNCMYWFNYYLHVKLNFDLFNRLLFWHHCYLLIKYSILSFLFNNSRSLNGWDVVTNHQKQLLDYFPVLIGDGLTNMYNRNVQQLLHWFIFLQVPWYSSMLLIMANLFIIATTNTTNSYILSSRIYIISFINMMV